MLTDGVKISELKTSWLDLYIKKGQFNPSVEYDEVFDALLIKLVDSPGERVLLYVNGDNKDFGIVFNSETGEITGFQIENIKRIIK